MHTNLSQHLFTGNHIAIFFMQKHLQNKSSTVPKKTNFLGRNRFVYCKHYLDLILRICFRDILYDLFKLSTHGGLTFSTNNLSVKMILVSSELFSFQFLIVKTFYLNF